MEMVLTKIKEKKGFPRWLSCKESACKPGDARDVGLIPGLGRLPGGGNGNRLQYSFQENPHGQRSLGGYSLWGLKRVRHDLATKQHQQREKDDQDRGGRSQV